MKRILALALVAAATQLSMGAPPEVPSVIKAKPGQLVRITVKAAPDKLGSARNFKDEDAFWGELVGPKGTRQFVFQAPALEYDAAGKAIPPKRAEYGLTWWTGNELEGTTTTIVIEGVPPKPVDPDVKPANPLVKALATAFASETSEDRRERMQALIDVMRTASAMADRPTYTTNADLLTAVTADRKRVVDESLPEVRAAIGAYLGGLFPREEFPLTADDRAKFKAAYTKLAVALEEVLK